MFVPRSSARLRLARLLFLGLALGPSALVAAWAAHLRSDGHRDDVRRGWERALGVPLRVDAVTHPRPGVVRVGSCVIAEPDGPARLAIPAAEVETGAAEVRLRIPSLRCDAAAARLLATLAADWLARGARFDRNCVIEVDDFAWATPEAGLPGVRRPAAAASGLRVECVATADGRAVRVVRRGTEGQPGSEARVVRAPVDVRARDIAEPAAAARIDLVATWTEPLPWEVLVALVSAPPPAPFAGVGAAVTGRVDAWRDDRGWHGSSAGRLDGVDLAACGAALGVAAAGRTTIDVRTIEWSAGRITDCELECRVGRGHVSASFLEALVGTLGCRSAVPLGGAAGAGGIHPFDAAGALVRIHAGGLELLAGPRLSGALAIADARPLIWPPSGPVAVERLAWLLAPPRTPLLPAAGPGAWLMGIMPRTAADDGPGAEPGERTPRREF